MKLKSIIAATASVAVLTTASVSFAAQAKGHHAAKAAKPAKVEAAAPAPVAIAVSAPAFTWDGAYVGANAGFGLSGSKYKAKKDEPVSETLRTLFPSAKGVVACIYGGYNYQLGPVVLGAQADFNYAKVKGDKKGDKTSSEIKDDSSIEQKWVGAARARVGYAVGSFMPYVSGGVAYTYVTPSLTAEAASNNNKAPKKQDDKGGHDHANVFADAASAKKDEAKGQFLLGYTVGAGLDYALAENLLLRAEYRFSDYKSFKHSVKVGAANAEDKNFTFHTNDVRVGIAYKF